MTTTTQTADRSPRAARPTTYPKALARRTEEADEDRRRDAGHQGEEDQRGAERVHAPAHRPPRRAVAPLGHRVPERNALSPPPLEQDVLAVPRQLTQIDRRPAQAVVVHDNRIPRRRVDRTDDRLLTRHARPALHTCTGALRIWRASEAANDEHDEHDRRRKEDLDRKDVLELRHSTSPNA